MISVDFFVILDSWTDLN